MRITPYVAGGHHATVYLDGEKLQWCVEADDIEGWARCVITGPDGRPVHSPAYDEQERTEIRRGAVRIAFDDPAWRQLAEAAIALEQAAPSVEILVKVKRVVPNG